MGKVKDYNGHYGKIITNNKIYTFLNIDVFEQETIENDDYVLFRGEFINGTYRAYFVKFFSKNINDFNNKELLRKAVMKGS